MKTAFEYFMETVEQFPFFPALYVNDQEYSYIELKSEVIKMANFMRHIAPSTSQVGIFAYKSKEAYTAVLASLAFGATFVPLNKKFPIERTAGMISQAGLELVIVDHASINELYGLPEDLLKNLIVIAPEIDHLEKELGCKRFIGSQEYSHYSNARYVKISVQETDNAYILFTSGSTGVPKGVPVMQKNLSSFIQYNRKRYNFSPFDRFTQTFDLTFDLSLFDLFMPWSSGGCVYVMQPEVLLSPYDFINKHEITVWFSVPSVINILMKQGHLKSNVFPTLKYSLFCGEALAVTSVKEWMRASPQAIVENLYGPTELTIACAAYRLDGSEFSRCDLNNIVPIGRVYEHLDFLVLDENNAEASEGELWVSGDQKFPGYLQDEEKTRQVTSNFIKDGKSLNYYRTGDRVRLAQTKELLYIGRMDHQIKVQGYRVELGEVEASLKKLPGVVDAIAVGQAKKGGSFEGIAAFLTGNNLNEINLKNLIGESLPSYMVPKALYVREKLPLNSNGKIDRKLLSTEVLNYTEFQT